MAAIIDLTEDAPPPPCDHMHTIVSLLRPETVRAVEKDGQQRRKAPGRPQVHATRYLEPISKCHLPRSQALTQETNHDEPESSLTQSQLRLPRRCDSPSYFPSSHLSGHAAPQPEIDVEVLDEELQILGKTSRRSLKTKDLLKPFFFLNLPPEIRNSVYRLVLTTPNAPIELPKLTGLYGRKRAAQWRSCTTAMMKRRHKTIFLEILETCKQIHDEASGIMYGCNTFKYRSDHKEGPKHIVLPTRHLQLLKHIKISVISGNPNNGQEKWVADLIRCFVVDGIRLETFELTWFGWKRYALKKDSVVCRALQSLNVAKYFLVKVTGEARMQKTMKEELDRTLPANTVEIHRPVNSVLGRDVDDDE